MPQTSNEMLPEAMALARHGAVVIAINAPFNRRQGPPLQFTEADSAEQVQLMVDLRRAVDVLQARPDVDPKRIGYYGYSYGAAMGALLAGIENRIRTYILAVGDGGLVAHVTGPDDNPGPSSQLPEAQWKRWLAAMEPIEPIRFVHLAPPAPILFQAARRDQYVPVSDAERLHEAASTPKEVRWYDSDHGMNEQAALDRLEWFSRHLGITRP